MIDSVLHDELGRAERANRELRLTLAAVVHSAGGEITVRRRDLETMSPLAMLQTSTDPSSGDITISLSMSVTDLDREHAAQDEVAMMSAPVAIYDD